MTPEYNPWLSYLMTAEYFSCHLAVMVLLAAIFTYISYLKNRPDDSKKGSWVAGKFVSLLAFACLGIALSFFLSRGITFQSKEANPLLTGIATIIIPLITGGITYLESSPIAGQPAQTPRSGIAVFLLACLLSYQSFYYQITYS